MKWKNNLMTVSERFSRTSNNTKNLIIVATEGKVTEPAYFEKLNKIQGRFLIEVAEYIDSSPKHVLQALKNRAKLSEIDTHVKLWVVVDRDKHHKHHFEEIVTWCKSNHQYGLAISNPCFELWLIFHHESTNQFENHKFCQEYCRKKFGYRKNKPNFTKLKISDVKDAVKRAKKIDKTNSLGWPIESGCSTVYRIIEDYV